MDGAGGAGGTTCCAGGGGYTGGSTRYGCSSSDLIHFSDNGLAGKMADHDIYNAGLNGGGYFEGPSGDYESQKIINSSGNELLNIRMISIVGGIGNQGAGETHQTGNGGIAGEGGSIAVSSQSKIYAYNGNRYTDGTNYENGKNQCPIYLQRGIINSKYKYIGWGYINSTAYNYKPRLELQITQVGSEGNILSGYENSALSNLSQSERSINIMIGGALTTIDMSRQGIGSGAGYIELSNGTYTVDPSMN